MRRPWGYALAGALLCAALGATAQRRPVLPQIDPPFAPAKLPRAATAQQPPPAASPWQFWGWVAAGIFVLSLLARLLHDYVARKQTARGSEKGPP